MIGGTAFFIVRMSIIFYSANKSAIDHLFEKLH